ncbi:MAG: VWA domain-containing protein [Pseudomonadota bacterium]
MNLAFSHPWVLSLCALAILPLLRSHQARLRYSWAPMIPADNLSRLLDTVLRLATAGAIVALTLGMAGPYLREQTMERIGTGAQIILLLDRSASMNENFVGRYMGGGSRESKAVVARQLLTDFVTRDRKDLFGLAAFSTSPIYVMPLTQDREAVLAAIRSGESRGRGVTNIAAGLAMALDFFTDRPVTGSRVVLFVSDGAARIEPETGELLGRWFRENQVALYWLYLRNPHGVSLFEKPENPNETTTPEYFLHQYFLSIDIPYRAYEAENPEALEKAIADIERLENKPIRYPEKIPRQDLSGWCYAAAAMLLVLLLPAKALEVQSWSE